MVFENLRFPKRIFHATSNYNERIEVFQIGKTRLLSVNNTAQSTNWDSPFVKKRIWGRLVDFVKEKRPNAKSILILGLGGGTICHLFSKEMPNTQMVVVEIDKVIIDIAKKFFDLDSVPNLKVICADAFRVISEPEKFNLHPNSFDVVVVDIYSGDKYPDLATTGSFFAGIKWFAKSSGLLIFNRVYFGHHQQQVDEFYDLIKNVYANVGKVMIPGRTNSDNLLIYAEV